MLVNIKQSFKNLNNVIKNKTENKHRFSVDLRKTDPEHYYPVWGDQDTESFHNSNIFFTRNDNLNNRYVPSSEIMMANYFGNRYLNIYKGNLEEYPRLSLASSRILLNISLVFNQSMPKLNTGERSPLFKIEKDMGIDSDYIIITNKGIRARHITNNMKTDMNNYFFVKDKIIPNIFGFYLKGGHFYSFISNFYKKLNFISNPTIEKNFTYEYSRNSPYGVVSAGSCTYHLKSGKRHNFTNEDFTIY